MGYFGAYFGGYFAGYFGAVGIVTTPAVGDLVDWPIAPTFEAGGIVTFSWQTEINESRDGTEQRHNYLVAPFKTYKLQSKLIDSESRAMLAMLQRSLNLGARFHVGEPHEELIVQAVNGQTLSVNNTLTDWTTEGQRVLIRRPDRSVVSTWIALAPTATDIYIGDALTIPKGSRVMPAVPCFLVDSQGYNRHPVNVGELDLDMRSELTRYPASNVVGVGGSVTTYDGLPVWSRGVGVDGTAIQNFVSGAQLVGYGARSTAIGNYARTKGQRGFSIMSSKRVDWQSFKLFMSTIRGPWGAFLLPTGRPDFLIHNPSAAGGILQIKSDGDYMGAWFPSLAHRRIQLTLSDGSIQRRKVTSGVDNVTYQDLQLDSPVVGNIVAMEMLETVRLESDSYDVTWTGRVFSCGLSAKVVQA